ncbi:MAG: FAD-binding protein [Opitutales bacterium]|nr:FAD-binding protein [Opitutales bacterium]
MNCPSTIEEAIEFVRGAKQIIPAGVGTKRPKTDSPDILDLSDFTGIIEYEPSEYTFSARAGTTIAEINEALKINGQYLPFDPPFVDAGATLGGTIASGLSGPGRLRYGGIRDFLIGIRILNGEGVVIQGGGKVVKNAAGYDYPKLFCGAMGTLGILLETTFKVFPSPRATRTLELSLDSKKAAIETLCIIARSQWEPDALEFFPEHNKLLLRLAGNADALDARLPKILQELSYCDAKELPEGEATDQWHALQEFDWAPRDAHILKAPITPKDIPELDQALSSNTVTRHYGMAGNVAWIAITENQALEKISTLLEDQGIAAGTVRGNMERFAYGKTRSQKIHKAVKGALDPLGKFPFFQ